MIGPYIVLVDTADYENSPLRKLLLLSYDAGLQRPNRKQRIGSQALEPEWTSIAGSHKSLMSIDCSAEPAVCDEFGITSYPALRFFDGHGHAQPYRGPRRASSYVERHADLIL